MTISRRKFVKAGILAAALGAAPVKSVLSQSWKERDGNPTETPPTQNDPLANYSRASFASYLNSVFQIQTVTGAVTVSLAGIDDMPAPKGGECFTLVFRGGSTALRQDTYVIEHAALGTFQLFLVPAGSDQNGAREYSATINRLSLVDFTNMNAPSRSVTGTRSTSTQSSTAGSTSTTQSTSTGNSATQVNGPAVTQTSAGAASVVVAPKSSSSVRQGKRKPARKRVDPKTPFLN